MGPSSEMFTRILQQPSDLGASGRSVCVAIGVFDGVHLGHQAVLEAMRQRAERLGGLAVAVTFDRHPRSILTPELSPPLIQSVSQKLSMLTRLGLDAVWIIPFDLAFSRIEGLDFIRQLRSGFGGVASIFLGSDFHFGHRRSGNAASLAQWGVAEGFTVHAIPPVQFEGQPISSTRVRNAVSSGDFSAVSSMLGRRFELCGIVRKGAGMGGQLQFPTANLDVEGRVFPPPGVYGGRASVEGKWVKAAINIGYRPTLNQPVPVLSIEAHLIDWTGDLYGREVALEFVWKIRDEMKFPSLDALRNQISMDVQAVRDCASI